MRPGTDVQLPHDYVILQTPKEEENGALGYFHYENAWYRKHFILSAEDSHKRITLLFEAVAIHCKIYVNGCYMLANNCGYNSFEVDITDVAVFGGENVVAVFIDVSEHEGWWYEGAGIYRPVWLIKAEPVSVDLYGVFIHPEKCAECWRVPIETTLRNDGYESRHVRVSNVIVDANDFQVASLEDEVVFATQKRANISSGDQDLQSSLLGYREPESLYAANGTLYRRRHVRKSDKSFWIPQHSF